MPHEYRGQLRYFADLQVGAHRLLVALPCVVGELEDYVFALLDTAAEWCVLPPVIAQQLGLDLTPDPDVPPLRTRLGTFHGSLQRLMLRFETDGGPVEVDATWFVANDWPGPAVLGWKGALERLQFALDPREEAFWVGGLDSS